MHTIAVYLALVVYTPVPQGGHDVTVPQSWRGPTAEDYSACQRQAFAIMMAGDAVAQCDLAWDAKH
jgi:hypothetical protein